MYNLLYVTSDSDVTFPPTQPELIESINFPAEKYDNINDISYIFDDKKIIIFDLDGTVADTETLHWKAYNKLLEHYDIYLDYEKVKDYIGHSEISIYESLKSDFNIDFDNEDFMENRINMYLELVRETDLRPYNFIYDILEKYKDICSFVLVTSQIPSVVNVLLKLWNIDKYFLPENIFCCHDKRYDKKGLYQSIKEYGDKNKKYSANNILLIEDSEHYMESAKKLGFSVIGIEHRYNINTLISCDAILAKYAAKGLFVGLCGLDIIYYGMSEMPENNSKKKITNFISSVGGPAANAAITYSILGGEAYLFTAVGNNEISRLVKQMLAEYNVKLIDISNADRNCNISSIYVNTTNGDRTIISGQSSRRLRIDNVSELEENIRKSEFVLYDGNLLGVEKFMIQYIEYYGKDLVIDAGSNKEGFKTCFAVEPVVISSESFKNEDGLDVFELNKLYGFRNCAKTRGRASILYESKGEIHEILVPDVKAVDTLGAGDVFHGAYCFFRYVKNHSFEDALKFAVQVASYSTCQKGVVAGVLYAKRKMEQII